MIQQIVEQCVMLKSDFNVYFGASLCMIKNKLLMQKIVN